MSQENVEIVRRVTESFNKSGIGSDETLSFFDPEAVFEEPPEQPAPRTANGREELAQMFGEFDAAWEEHQSRPEEIRAIDEERVLVLSVDYFRGRDGIEIEQPSGGIFTLRDGRIVRFQAFWERSTAIEAAGLSPAVIHHVDVKPEGDQTGGPVVLVHGYPESSRMWAPLMDALVAEGRQCVAPDLYCLGESDDPGPATFERNVEALTELMEHLDLGRVALVVHDWGAFIGLAWACEHPDLVSALVISDSGFFSDGKWHGVAEGLRSPQGEEVMAAIDRNGFSALLRADGAQFSDEDIDAYWHPFAEGRGREATLEFYRSMDFVKLAPYEGKLAELGVPTLLLWGAEDQFAPLSGAKRFEREIPGARLVAIEGAGHFVFDQEPERTTREVVDFLASV